MSKDIFSRYEQAKEIMQGIMPNRVVLNDTVFSHWIECSPCFWYSRETKNGKEYRLVDAKAGINTLAFDHSTLAELLEGNTGQNIDPLNLPIKDMDVKMTLSPLELRFQALGSHWLFQPNDTQLRKIESIKPSLASIGDNLDVFPEGFPLTQKALCSPDGKKEVFFREHNVWVRDRVTNEEQALTHDGTADNRYARDVHSVDTTLQAQWSPDSKQLFTVQLDTRKVLSRPSINYLPKDGTPQPQHITYTKLAYAGDKHVETYQLIVINMQTGKVQKVDYPPLPLIYYGGVASGFFRAHLGWWSHDNQHAFFVDVTRGSKTARLVKLDTHTGSTQVLFEETSDTFVKLRHQLIDNPVFLPLAGSDELIWFSEGTGYSHLYLYDLHTGELKHPITKGEWFVRDILHYDAGRRELLIQSAARDPNISPYYRGICKVNIDTGELSPIVSDNFDYRVYQPDTPVLVEFVPLGIDPSDVNGVSPSGSY